MARINECQIEINQRYTSDFISVYPSEDGLTVRLQISQPMSTFPLMYMGGGEIALSRNQWRRLKEAIDNAFKAGVPHG